MRPQLRRFVVGVDDSGPSVAALRWAVALASAAGAEIVAVNGFTRRDLGTAADNAQLRSDFYARLAPTWTGTATEAGVSIRPMVLDGDARNVVHEVAEAEDADLIVLGRTGRGGGPGLFHVGSIVEHAAHHTNRPLAVIPEAISGPIERIVLGVDGSPHAMRAMEWCGELAKVTDASVVAVSVEEPYLEWTPVSSPKNWRRDLERRIDEWVAPMTAAGVTVDHAVERNLHPADGLLAMASAKGGDVLVLGTRGAGGFLGLRAGGVAMKVLHRASLPIVLVPPEA